MSSFFELFSPSLRFQREQRDLEKTLVVKTPTTGKGPVQVDLDKGQIRIRRAADQPESDVAAGRQEAADESSTTPGSP